MSNKKKVKLPQMSVNFPIIAMSPGTDSVYLVKIKLEQKKGEIAIPNEYKGASNREDEVVKYERWFCLKAGDDALKRFPTLDVSSEIGVAMDSVHGSMAMAKMFDFATGNEFHVIHYMQIQGVGLRLFNDEQLEEQDRLVQKVLDAKVL